MAISLCYLVKRKRFPTIVAAAGGRDPRGEYKILNFKQIFEINIDKRVNIVLILNNFNNKISTIKPIRFKKDKVC